MRSPPEGGHYEIARARSFGAPAERAETTEAFASAFERARSAGRSAVLELVMDRDQITPERRLSAVMTT